MTDDTEHVSDTLHRLTGIRPNTVIVGADVNGLELRMVASLLDRLRYRPEPKRRKRLSGRLVPLKTRAGSNARKRRRILL
jgi:hypothetical protein